MFRAYPLAAFLFVAAPAFAQEAPSGGFALSGETLIVTDYRFRGISRSDEDPAAQLSVTLAHDRGFYAGARGTTLKGIDPFRARDPGFGDLGDIQLDLSAGWRADLGGGFDLDAGLTYYAFAGGRGATGYAEPYASIGYLIGPAQFSTGIRYAPAQDGTGGEDMVVVNGIQRVRAGQPVVAKHVPLRVSNAATGSVGKSSP